MRGGSGLATRRARISDIADRLGVSSATVSRAISGRGYVRADLAEKIRAVAVELNYGLPDLNVGRRVLLAASNDAMVDFQRAQFTTHVLDGLRQRAAALGIEPLAAAELLPEIEAVMVRRTNETIGDSHG